MTLELLIAAVVAALPTIASVAGIIIATIIRIKNGNKTIKLDIKKKFNSNELENMNFWNFIKTLSADLLLDIENSNNKAKIDF